MGQALPKRDSASDRPAYSAPGSCPDAARWIDEILARLTTDARELGRQQLPELVESLEVTPDGKRALLRLRGSADARVVVGNDCSEVIAGAALIVAIAFDSGLGAEPIGVPEPASAPEPKSESAMPEPPSARRSMALEGHGDRGDSVALDSGARQPERRPAAPASAAIGVGASAHTGVAPWPAGVLDGAVELSWPERGWSVRARGSLGLARAVVRERSARFVFIGGSFELCPMISGAHFGWRWSNCVGLELGRVHSEGEAASALARAEKSRMWWAAPGLVTRLQSPRLHGVRFEAEGGASAPLWHREFEFRDPDISVFQTPLLALTARLGLQVPLD